MGNRLSTEGATQEVIEYLATQSPCNFCNKPLFDSYINTFLPLTPNESPLVQYHLCSHNCFRTLRQKYV
jgi:hypothetical protein